MTAREIQAAWKIASHSGDFYAEFEKLTGFTPTEVREHFGEWNRMPHEDAIKIAEDAGVTLSEAGFSAYLATFKSR